VNELINREQERRKPPEFRLSLNIAHNEIDSFIRKGASGTGLLIDCNLTKLRNRSQSEDTPAGSKIILSSNQIRNRSQEIPTAMILHIDMLTMTGNLILNDEPIIPGRKNTRSLRLSPGASASQKGQVAFAITGNVFQGNTNLASFNRTGFSPPLDTWSFANTEI
jgi:hypothetical protein